MASYASYDDVLLRLQQEDTLHIDDSDNTVVGIWDLSLTSQCA
jgi:hypothetical protein